MKTAYVNGRWWRDGQPVNLLVENGVVAYRGSERPYSDSTIDLDERFVAPAFVEPHCHILPSGLHLQRLNLQKCFTPEDVMNAVRKRASEIRNGDWLLAVQFDANRFPVGTDLSAADLDRVAPDLPIVLRHSSGHSCLVNTVAMRLANIHSASNPVGGVIVRTDEGKPTGSLLETAMKLVDDVMPQPSKEGMRDAILAAGQAMRDVGICAAADMQTGYTDIEKELWAYRAAADSGCRVRMRLYLEWDAVFGEDRSEVDLIEDDSLRIAGIKLFADGAIGPATAAIYGVYDDGQDGTLIYPPEELCRRISVAEAAGYSVAIHSIGDRSTDVVLDCLEKCVHPRRHRLEHVMLLSDQQIARMKRLGASVVLQPAFLHHFGAAYERRLGERVRRLKPCRSIAAAGIPICFSSDSPIVPFDPIAGMRAACFRPALFDQSENVAPEDSLDFYTRSAAAVLGEAGKLGALDIGATAEFALHTQSLTETVAKGIE